jgi:hypothetical protein
MPLQKILLIFCLSLCGTLNAQDGTIRVKRKDSPDRMPQVQRNPVQLPCSVCCGGVLQRARILIELSAFQPLRQPYEVFYNYYQPSSFTIGNGFGAHFFLSAPRLALHYGDDGFSKFYLFTGYDRFGGENTGTYRYQYSRIPLHLAINTSLLTGDRLVLLATGDAGGDALLAHYRDASSSSDTRLVKPGYAVGLEVFFIARKKAAQGIRLRSTWMDQQWFREVSLIIPVYYGPYGRNGNADAE